MMIMSTSMTAGLANGAHALVALVMFSNIKAAPENRAVVPMGTASLTQRKTTVTVSLSLGSIEEVTKEDLMDLLTINGDLLGASLTITPPLGEEQEEFLMLQTKFVATEFSEDMFNKSITSLMTQMSIFFEAE